MLLAQLRELVFKFRPLATALLDQMKEGVLPRLLIEMISFHLETSF